MYFTSLPNHNEPGFDEQQHFSRFKKHNIIFNAVASKSQCDWHVGCLSFKTVLTGEEWYGIDNRRLAVRPGQFLMLNDDQPYSSQIDHDEKVRMFCIFFKKEFAAGVFKDIWCKEEKLLDDPFDNDKKEPEFFQTLYNTEARLQMRLCELVSALSIHGYSSSMVDGHLVFLLRYLIAEHQSTSSQIKNVDAIKYSTRVEVFNRLCVAKDVLHSCYTENIDLLALSNAACLSVPQLVRQFKAVFNTTPHQYLIKIRLQHAAELLKHSGKPVHEITWRCGFENTSAFCRAFKVQYGLQPAAYRANA